MDPARIDLVETGEWQRVSLTAGQVRLLELSGLVQVRHDPDRPGWQVRAGTWVGAVLLGADPGPRVDLRIEPKVPIGRLLFLLGYARSPKAWRNDPVLLPAAAGLPAAIAEALIRLTDRALAQGLLQGYRHHEETATTLRGRIRFNDQLRQHLGAALPVEVSYDEYTPDTALNQILHSALLRMLAVPGLPQATRLRLNRLRNRFAGVAVLRPGTPLPRWQPDRLNTRYQPAVHLAELVLSGSSFDLGRGTVPATGFAVNMATAFERFLETALRDALTRARGGCATGQDAGWTLDRDRAIPLRPDLVWYPERSGPPGLVIDAKYKAEQPSGFPNADVYQLLAYCSALGLSHGHLVYAEGNEVQREHFLPGTGPGGRGVTVHVHTLDLAAEPVALLGQVDALAAGMVGGTGARTVRQGPSTSGRTGTHPDGRPTAVLLQHDSFI